MTDKYKTFTDSIQAGTFKGDNQIQAYNLCKGREFYFHHGLYQ